MKLKEWSYFIKILEVYDSPKDERFKDNPLAKSLVSSSILDPETGHYRYSSRGHHPAIIINKNGELKLLELRGTFIGLNKIVKNEDLVFEQGEGILKEGDKVYLYTDGIIELKNIK